MIYERRTCLTQEAVVEHLAGDQASYQRLDQVSGVKLGEVFFFVGFRYMPSNSSKLYVRTDSFR